MNLSRMEQEKEIQKKIKGLILEKELSEIEREGVIYDINDVIFQQN